MVCLGPDVENYLLLVKSAVSFPILAYPHAPEQGLVSPHSYRLPGVTGGNRFIGVGGAH